MYNEECRREIDEFFDALNTRRNNLPSEMAIFNLLETFSYDRSVIGNSISQIQEYLINSAFTACRTNPVFVHRKRARNVYQDLELIDKKNSDDYIENYRGVEYGHLVFRKECHKTIEYNDLIWLHFALLPEKVQTVGDHIFAYLAKAGISAHVKVPNVIGPDSLVIGVYTKDDANSLLDFCANDSLIQESIMLNNPFMPHRHGIGVVKETQQRSFTRHLSSLIYEYALTSKDPKLSFVGFIRYASKLFNEEKVHRTYQERYLDYQVTLASHTIYKKLDYLDNVSHLPQLSYSKEEFEKYRVTFEENEYRYTNRDGEVVTSENVQEWLKLQAYNCIHRMYYEQTGELPKENIKLGYALTGAMSSLVDSVMKAEPFQVSSNYRDPMVQDLYPYLVAYYAYQAKLVTTDEIKNIISKVKNRMITKLKVDGASKNFYQIGDKTIQSTIPPIRIDNTLVGIEYLDYELNYCNVFIYQDGNVQGYLGLFLDTEKDKIWEENDITASAYRAHIARLLIDYDNLDKEIIVRGVHEGTYVNLISDESKVVEEPVSKQK